jgi:hypothetical protein
MLEALVFSGLWVSVAAATLVAAVSLVLGSTPDLRGVSLAFAGTFSIYAIDRLRDHVRDADRAPMRSAFVRRHRGALVPGVALASLAAALCAVALGPGGITLALVAGAIGLLHRRLKERVLFKAGYITAVWLVVVVGLPALTARAGPGELGWICAVLGPALLANAIAFNVRDDEALVALLGRRRALAIARAWASLALVVALVAPPALRPLAAIALATVVALVCFRGDEHYAHVAVDGALVAGAVAACVLAV